MNPMSVKGKEAVAAVLLSAAVVLGCKMSGGGNSNATNQPANAGAATNTAKANMPPTKADSDGVIASGTGTEKEKPSAGKANVQGKAFYNEQPAAGVDVTLCEKFNRFFGGCSGQKYTTKTDAAGEYLIKDVPPKVYEGLTVRVFNTPYYVFATSGFINNAKYNIESDKTFFAPDTHLFKQDMKLVSPKAGAKVAASGSEVKWDAYPDAAYYKMSIFADNASGAQPEYDYINKRVDGLSYTLDKPLTPGSYNIKVEAFNGNDIKLAQSPGDIKFTVAGEAAKPAEATK
jgi:hypothetical protein